MAVVQSAYVERQAAGLAGQIATMTPYTVDSYEVTGAPSSGDGLRFGYGVRAGTNLGECQAGAQGTASTLTDFLGVAVSDHAREGGDPENAYVNGNIAAVLSRGDIWVPVEAAVTAGDSVAVNNSTGQLGDTADGTHSPVPGRWMTTQATANGLAMVRLFGTIA